MYRFKDVMEPSLPDMSRLQTIVDGVNLDVALKGFRTLAVYGRELIGRDVETRKYRTGGVGGKRRATQKSGSSGYMGINKMVGSSISTRSLVVDFHLESKDWREQIEAFECLNYLINKDSCQLVFTDDLDFYWEACLGTLDTIDVNQPVMKGELKFEVMNPFKLKRAPEVFHLDTEGTFKKNTLYPVHLEAIKIQVKESGDKLLLKNTSTGDRIILNKDFSPGDEVLMNLLDNTVSGKNGESLMSCLDIRSNLESFSLSYKDIINTSLRSEVDIRFREARL